MIYNKDPVKYDVDRKKSKYIFKNLHDISHTTQYFTQRKFHSRDNEGDNSTNNLRISAKPDTSKIPCLPVLLKSD